MPLKYGDGIDDIGVGSSVNNSTLQIFFYEGNGNLLKILSKTGGYDSHMRPVTRLQNGNIVVSEGSGYSRDPRGYAVFNYNIGNEIWYYDVVPAHAITSIVDMDKDGKDEIIASNGNLKQYILDYNLNVLSNLDLKGYIELVNDIDGDGNLEIVISDGPTIRVLEGNLNEKWNYKCWQRYNKHYSL